MDDAKLAKMPTPETCAGCHKKQTDQFSAGKHNLAWVASSSMPMMGHQPKAVAGEGYKGCSQLPQDRRQARRRRRAQMRYGHAQCDSCHTRHSFKKSEAQDPRACQTCHMGFDHPQWEMWSTSKHGTIWQIEGKDSKRAPTCQTCHMTGGDHNVITSWGFLALAPARGRQGLDERPRGDPAGPGRARRRGQADGAARPGQGRQGGAADGGGIPEGARQDDFGLREVPWRVLCQEAARRGRPGGEGSRQGHGRGDQGRAGPLQGRRAQEARGLGHRARTCSSSTRPRAPWSRTST